MATFQQESRPTVRTGQQLLTSQMRGRQFYLNRALFEILLENRLFNSDKINLRSAERQARPRSVEIAHINAISCG